MRGYFGIGVEGLSKAMNAGNLFRTAHAFGASFVFTVNARYSVTSGKSDTSRTPLHVPWHAYDSPEALALPEGCELVGIEFLEEAAELPTFHHPQQAAYVLGPERGSLSPALLPPRGADPDPVLREPGHRRGDRDVRPDADPRPLRGTADIQHRRAGGTRAARAWRPAGPPPAALTGPQAPR